MNQAQQMTEALGGQNERVDVETLKIIRAALQSASINADILSTPDIDSITFVIEPDKKSEKDLRRVLDRVRRGSAWRLRNLDFVDRRTLNVSKRVAFIYKMK